MLVLLPPSEGKATAVRGRPVALDALSLPGLNDARAAVLDELTQLCQGDEDKAAQVLGLSPGLRGEIAKNAALLAAPAIPAEELYTGVLYDALGLSTLDATARRRARRSLLVFSGLWGRYGSATASRRTAARWAYGCRGRAGSRRTGGRTWTRCSRPRPATDWCSTCARRRTRGRGSRAARRPGGRRPYGCFRSRSWPGSRSGAW